MKRSVKVGSLRRLRWPCCGPRPSPRRAGPRSTGSTGRRPPCRRRSRSWCRSGKSWSASVVRPSTSSRGSRNFSPVDEKELEPILRNTCESCNLVLVTPLGLEKARYTCNFFHTTVQHIMQGGAATFIRLMTTLCPICWSCSWILDSLTEVEPFLSKKCALYRSWLLHVLGKDHSMANYINH